MLHEARALARVQHPNVVVVHDAEERDGRVGLCMEFIRGRRWRRLLSTEGPRGAREAALIGQDSVRRWPPCMRPASCTATSRPRTSCARTAAAWC